MNRETIRAWAEIDLRAMQHNLQVAREKTGKKVMCVIKGDAHGHGAVASGRALEEAGADALAVACLTEAIALREGGIHLPILILGWTPPEYADEMVANRLTQSVLEEDYACRLSRAVTAGTLRVHVKLDTGMSRTGIFAQDEPEKAAAAICRIRDLPHLKIGGIFTHFAAADAAQKDDFTAWQVQNYLNVLNALEKMGFRENIIRHTGNSAGIFFHSECHFDMVRAGVMLYGLSPTNGWDQDLGLEPILTLKARVAQVKELPAGTHISYGCTYEAPRNMNVAVVTAGYADSYPRGLSNQGAWAIINGQRCLQVGRICMDMCMFDVTGKNVRVGDEVILYGRGGMTLEAVTNRIGTINCEPTCLLTNRVARVYVRGKG